MSNGDDPDDPSDGDTGPHCKDQSDAFDAADDEYWDAVVDLEAKFGEIVERGTEEMIACQGDGVMTWECDNAHLEYVDALVRYDVAETLEATRWSARYAAMWGLVDCISDHKFHGNIWF